MSLISRKVELPPSIIVIFGCTGDLAARKILPALYNLFSDGFLPEFFKIIGVARSDLNDQTFRNRVQAALGEFSRKSLEPDLWHEFSSNLHFVRADACVPGALNTLANNIKNFSANSKSTPNNIFYMATAPELFAGIATNLKAEGLADSKKSLLIVEKPFGHDLESSKTLNSQLRRNFPEERIFRIDHYLGKETVQNILVFRFGNAIFESVWNRKYVEQIQISVCEDIGVGSRSSYFDKAGITRDIIQNHLLQMLSLLCIEVPTSLRSADAIRNEKVKVLQSLKRFEPDRVKDYVVRGQYRAGTVSDKPVESYLDLPGIQANSQTETYAAMKLEVDNWRWSGVPIYIRAGKRLAKKITEILVFFKKPPGFLFGYEVPDNVLAIKVQPNEGIALSINSKIPGYTFDIKPVEMDFTYGESFAAVVSEAYERLILDAIKGDATLFARNDEIEEAWDFLAPVFDAFTNDKSLVLNEYEAGSWGPRAADFLLHRDGFTWGKL